MLTFSGEGDGKNCKKNDDVSGGEKVHVSRSDCCYSSAQSISGYSFGISIPFKHQELEERQKLLASNDTDREEYDDNTQITVLESGEHEIAWSSDEDDDNDSTNDKPKEDDKSTSNFKYLTWFLYFCFWATCYMIAIELKFGMVYLLFSALFGIYFNTRTEPKRKREISAYSVFNENCKPIEGSISPEQFERELRYGPASVR